MWKRFSRRSGRVTVALPGHPSELRGPGEAPAEGGRGEAPADHTDSSTNEIDVIRCNGTRCTPPCTESHPSTTPPPTLVGSGRVGTMLTCERGEWTGSGSYSYEWLLDGEEVEVGTGPGQTGSTNPKRFRASAEFAGKEVRCQVVKTNAQWGASEPAESNGVVVQAQVNVPQNVTPPSVTGSGKVGTMLTCDPGEWTLSGSYTYTWLLDGDPVPVGTGPGETGSTNPIRYRAKADEVGKSVVCRVTRTNGNGTSAPADSNAVVINTGS